MSNSSRRFFWFNIAIACAMLATAFWLWYGGWDKVHNPSPLLPQANNEDAGTALAVAGIIGLGVFFYARQAKGKALGGLGKYAKMNAQVEVPTTRFNHVAANEEALESLRGLVDFIANPQKYVQYGARIPRGVLLYGPPGTGKTLMARALAGEAGVPFFSVSGSDFVQVYVGVGASRVRGLFEQARKAERAVIFIDEIDALGKARHGGNDEREQTLNALLTEMSGFAAHTGVVVLAATNRLDTLDEALLRPGRFDRQIEVGLPGRAQRLRILELHAKDKPLSEQVDLDQLAANTVYFSGAKLESMLNEAAIYAARREAGIIEPDDVRRAFQAQLVGEEKQDRSGISPKEKQITAVHEAGHALATLHLTPDSRLTQVSIIPSTRGAAGYSMAVMPDKAFLSRHELLGHMAVAMAGRAGEALIFGGAEVTTGAANDLEKATTMAARMCLEWGMDEDIGQISRKALRDLAPVGEKDLKSVEKLVALAYDRAVAVLSANRAQLEALAGALEEREVLTGDQVRELVGWRLS